MRDIKDLPEVPQERSYKQAEEALGQLFDAIPRTKAPQHVRQLNIVGSYMLTMNGFFAAALPTGPERTAVPLSPVSDVLGEYIERVSAQGGDA